MEIITNKDVYSPPKIRWLIFKHFFQKLYTKFIIQKTFYDKEVTKPVTLIFERPYYFCDPIKHFL